MRSADRHSACATSIGVCFTLGANIDDNVTVKTRIVNSISLEIFIFGTTNGDNITVLPAVADGIILGASNCEKTSP